TCLVLIPASPLHLWITFVALLLNARLQDTPFRSCPAAAKLISLGPPAEPDDHAISTRATKASDRIPGTIQPAVLRLTIRRHCNKKGKGFPRPLKARFQKFPVISPARRQHFYALFLHYHRIPV